MPTILSHPAAALMKTLFRGIPRRAVAAGAVGSVLPDADVAGFSFGVSYGSTFGHRGFTHSIAFALLAAAAGTALLRTERKAATFGFLFACTMSHAVLDAFTNGGLGVAFLSPISNERYFFPWRPIEVSPIGIEGFPTRRGARVLLSEAKWVWLPFAAIGTAGLIRWHVSFRSNRS